MAHQTAKPRDLELPAETGWDRRDKTGSDRKGLETLAYPPLGIVLPRQRLARV